MGNCFRPWCYCCLILIQFNNPRNCYWVTCSSPIPRAARWVWEISVLQQGVSYKGVISKELLQMRFISRTPSCGLWLVKAGKSCAGVLQVLADIWHKLLLEAGADKDTASCVLTSQAGQNYSLYIYFHFVLTIRKLNRRNCGFTTSELRAVCFFLCTSPKFNLNWTNGFAGGFHHRCASVSAVNWSRLNVLEIK